MKAFDPKGAVVLAVQEDSYAAEAGLTAGDRILTVNGNAPIDLMDFLDQVASGPVKLEVLRDGKSFDTIIDADDDQSVGIEFTDTLFSRVKTCRNKCVFCFMDQMPKKMRPSLYYRDDDYRLSNLHGNFITLTNLDAAEWERIKTQRVSPLYISVHATEEKLREYLLGSTKQAQMDVMSAMRQLSEWNIQYHTQLVLMPGLNDGEALERSLNDLATLLPNLQTISIVPVGLTRYRAHLPNLIPVSAEHVPVYMEVVARHQEKFMKLCGDPIVFLADEMYLIAGLPQPPNSYYGDYPQLENGVGMVRKLLTDFSRRKGFLKKSPIPAGRFLMITGEYGGQIFPPLIEELHQRCPGLEVRLVPVKNEFFGPLVKCAGLLSGRDVLKALEQESEFLKQDDVTVLIPGAALKDAAIIGDAKDAVLLDDITLQSLADRFQVPFINAGGSCIEWLQSLRDRIGLQRIEPQINQVEPIVILQYPEHAPKAVAS